MTNAPPNEPSCSLTESELGGVCRWFDFEPVMIEFLLATHFEALPIPCRLVLADGTVVRQSKVLQQLIRPAAGRECCASLGFRHDADCPSKRTVETARPQRTWRWLGKLHVCIETTPVRDVSGNIVASFECFRDTTVEKRLEAALTRQQDLLETINKAMIETNHHLEDAQVELEEKNALLERVNEELRSLDRLKDEFVSVVSHELKAPLTSIKASVELALAAEQQCLDPQTVELLSICRRNAVRLQHLVQDLLDMARIESGRLTLAYTTFSAAQAVGECLQAVSGLAEQKGLQLEMNVPESLVVQADHDRLIQVLVNLVNNAIKFTEQGHVWVSARSVNGQIEFCVEDTGVGIPAEQQVRIFDKFSQLGDPLHHKDGGTGLGLSIARGIVREHGGEMSVTSRTGHGSRFDFWIPQPPRIPGDEKNTRRSADLQV